MKKYIKPNTDTLKIEARTMFAASDPKLGGSYDGTETILGKDSEPNNNFSLWSDSDEEE